MILYITHGSRRSTRSTEEPRSSRVTMAISVLLVDVGAQILGSKVIMVMQGHLDHLDQQDCPRGGFKERKARPVLQYHPVRGTEPEGWTAGTPADQTETRSTSTDTPEGRIYSLSATDLLTAQTSTHHEDLSAYSSASTNILCHNFNPDGDNWMNDRYPNEANLSESELLQRMLKSVNRALGLQQYFGLMGKRSSAKSQITRRRQKFQTFVGLMGKRNMIEPGESVSFVFMICAVQHKIMFKG
ncbi:uncharacterized protein LOC127453370 [Myxocyprinus asiaticus]|uniref:uncharacterized protein LOC127453370 n=1 Tax=Myxocyprinus asiaticus TaxID=70543 RepID=UPI00222375B7|nr:uncharacterized protein LOC127453370 [Myxocyprinus asiaticus]